MNLSTISIQRPVLATVFTIVIVLFGAIGFTYLGVREYPSVDPPIVTVSTSYTGSSADIIESQITEPLEEAINSVSGINTVTSTSADGRSSIQVEFDLGIDMDNAANDIRDKVAQAVRSLPPDADPPSVQKSDADAQTIFALTVQSEKRSLLELSDIGLNMFKERLQTISGVSSINIWGDKRYAMRLEIDPDRLAAYGLTPLDVRNALLAQNVELPSGRIEGYRTELTIRTFGRLSTEEDFNNLLIADREGTLIRLKDIGKARLGPENERSLLRGNGGIPMIGIAIQPQPGSNYIEIVDEVKARIEQIKKELPDDLRLGVALDTTVSIRKAIEEVQQTVFIAFGLVVLVIFFFLRNWRTTLIPIVTIPISLVGSFFVMYLAGFSINILTLLGIVLATGLVVDDAIVVMENIYSKIEEGQDRIQAAFSGSREIFFAVISTTVTLVAVFLPVIFLDGVTGRLFREFGVVVVGSVVISSFISLSLTPMMSSRILKKSTPRRGLGNWVGKGLERMGRGYERSLRGFMRHRWLSFLVILGSVALVYVLGRQLPSELAPLEDKGRLRIFSTAPEGTSYEMMDAYIAELVQLTDTIAEKESLLSVTSPGFGSSSSVNSGFVRLTLKPLEDRERSQADIATMLTEKLKNYNFARSLVIQEQTISVGRGGRGLPVQFVVQAPTLEDLKAIVPEFLARANESEIFSAVDLDLKFNKPELQISIDRSKAREMGVEVSDIAQTLQLLYSGQRFGYFIKDGKQYYVIGEALRTSRDEPSDISGITVRNSAGEPVQLDNLVTTQFESSPPQLYRYNRFAAATFSAGPKDGYTIGQGIDEMRAIAAEVLDERYTTSLAGTSKEFSESSGSLLFAFLLALGLVYLTLAAQFESFRDPLTIMLTVPLAIGGAILALWLFGHTLNIFSQIGMIVLVGIVTKNGILIVEFANQRREQGLSIREAATDAAAKRFRPILMTSLATILGAMPIALALGGGSTSRIPMGVAIIGGLVFSLILTLYVIPVLYTLITSKREKKQVVEEVKMEEYA
ncbi:efflux RND transporter permease subunit [Neolewinella lacunae]|uniref:Efflux RND transporter permease subunit n=1 Tax=Neolewinella lacunae TaxID=1517758 RepID=A0A923PPU5_9BACT|nr:efflux RND transporter permease subunit [Neolewinella lacunae]MBC6995208.1 efflux RND transporter permease subunit [Neolewinella lacunae]MDN3635483.1 efflux RND transporter permease subunit [Neolewinella lacunae]